MEAPLAQDLTRLLERLEAGDRSAGQALAEHVYPFLHRMAERAMDRQPAGITLQPTALIHEAWLRLFPQEKPRGWKDRGHFLAVAARVMRNVLVDRARARLAGKRGGWVKREPLDAWINVLEARTIGLKPEREAQLREQFDARAPVE